MVGLIRLTRGDRFAEDFDILRVIAEGGMGTVYAVHDRTVGEARALKLLLPELIADERSRRRFTQEAQVASAIESPHVPQVYRGGIDPITSTPFIVMELLEGEDLRARVDRSGAIPVAEALALFEQLTHGLDAAHRAGIVHRDLKPGNVFLQRHPDGDVMVKLLDFGVAKLLDAHRTSGTGTGAVGSPMWMAPEQTSAGGRIAPSTDVWALGLLTFYCLTGKIFWESATGHQGVTGLLREIHLDPIPRPSDRAQQLRVAAPLPEGFDDWFERAVCRDQKLRYRDAGIAMHALRPVLRPQQVHSELAYASTFAFEKPTAPPGFDSMKTQPFAAPRVAASRAIPETVGPGSGLEPVSAPAPVVMPTPPPPEVAPVSHGRPAFTSPSRPTSTPAPRRGVSPFVWFVLLLVAGLAAAFLAAMVVWVVLTLSTP